MKYLRRFFQNRRVVYLIAHAPHMLLGVALVMVFSRLVPKEEFGVFARSFAFVNIVGAFLYGWLQISLLRFSNGVNEKKAPGGPALLSAAVLPVIPLFGLAFFMARIDIIVHPTLTALATAGYSLSVSFSQYARGANHALLYGLIGTVRMLVVLLVAFSVAMRLPDARALILALAIGAFTSIAVGLVYVARKKIVLKSRSSDFVISHESISLKDLFVYGAPASLSLVSVMLLIHADRFVASYFLNPGDLGLYSAQVDLARQMVYPIVSAIGVSLLPTAIHIDKDQGREAAELYISNESSFLLSLVFPLIILAVFYSNEIFFVLLPLDYSNSIGWAGPITAISAGLTGLRLLRFDPLFHISMEKGKIFFAAISGLVAWLIFAWPLAHLFDANGLASLGLIAAAVSCIFAYKLTSANVKVTNILSFRAFVAFMLCCAIVIADKQVIQFLSLGAIFHLILLGTLMLFSVALALKFNYKRRNV